MLSSRVTFAQHPRSTFASSPINATPASFIFVQPLCFPMLAHSFARREIRIFFLFNYFRTLFITTGVYATLPILELIPPRSIHLSFQRLTHDPFCKSFPLIYIHLMGGCMGGHMVTRKSVNSGPSISLAAPFAVQPILLSGRHSPRLYSPFWRSPCAGSRKKYPADPQRPVSHRESPWLQPGFSRLDARIPCFRAQNPCPQRGHEQLLPADCFLSDRFAHPEFLWYFHSGRPSRRRPHCHFQWLGHAQAQG